MWVETEYCRLWLGDCRDVLPTLDGVDAILTDPPFGIGNFVQINGNVRGDRVSWNDSIPSPDIFAALKTLSKHRIIWGANYFNCFEGRGALIWTKNQPMPNFSKAEIASVSWGNKIELLELTWTNYVNSKVSDHPCERPVELYLWCLSQFPNDPQTVFDPFMGSGTTAVACIRTGRKFIGCEIEPKYFEIALKRIREAEGVGSLFEGVKSVPDLFAGDS